MSFQYSYSITNDFLNGVVALDSFKIEIENSSISIALDRIDIDDTQCEIYFKAELPTEDQNTLIGLVAAHDGEPQPQMLETVIIKETENTLHVVQKGLPDFTGYSYFSDSVWGVAAANQVSHFYLGFDEIVAIQGGSVEVDENVNQGDFFALDFTYGIGGPVVGSLVTKKGVMPSTMWARSLPDAKEIPVGIKLRLTYNNTGTNDVFVIVAYDLRRTPQS